MGWLDGVQCACVLKIFSIVSWSFLFSLTDFSFFSMFCYWKHFLFIPQILFKTYFMPGTQGRTVNQIDPTLMELTFSSTGLQLNYCLYLWFVFMEFVNALMSLGCAVSLPSNLLSLKWNQLIKNEMNTGDFQAVIHNRAFGCSLLKTVVHMAAQSAV